MVANAVFRLAIARSVPEIFAIEVKTCKKSRRIVQVFAAAPIFFVTGSLPKFWDPDYKTEHTSDHVAKFQGDRPMEISWRNKSERKEIITSAVKHKTAGNCRSMQPKNIFNRHIDYMQFSLSVCVGLYVWSIMSFACKAPHSK